VTKVFILKNKNLIQRDLLKSIEKDFKVQLKQKDLELEKLSEALNKNYEENQEIQRLYANTKRNLEKLELERKTKKTVKNETELPETERKESKESKKTFDKIKKELNSKNNEVESLKIALDSSKSQLENSNVLVSELSKKNNFYKDFIDRENKDREKEKKDLVNELEGLKKGKDYFDKQKLKIAHLEEVLETKDELKEEQIQRLEDEIGNLKIKLEEIETKPPTAQKNENDFKNQPLNNEKKITQLKDAFQVCKERYEFLGFTVDKTIDKGNAKKIVQKSISSTLEIITKLQSDEEKDTYLLDFYNDDLIKKKGIITKLSKKEKKTSDESSDKVLLFNKTIKHGGHHGGAWKVAYADFVTAMMAFFLLMWLLSQLSENAKDNLVEYFKNYKVFSHTGKAIPKFKQENYNSDFEDNYLTDYQEVSQTEKNKDKKAEYIKEFKERYKGSEEHLSIELLAGGIRIQIMDLYDKNMFEKGSAKPTPESREILKFVSERIKTIPGNLIIEGHTDGYKFRGEEYTNWELSMDRASAARYELIKNGVLSNRVKRIVAYGSSEPLIKDDYMAPKNRRINIIIINENNN
jgi:chemotaxis protein MotB